MKLNNSYLTTFEKNYNNDINIRMIFLRYYWILQNIQINTTPKYVEEVLCNSAGEAKGTFLEIIQIMLLLM